MNAKAFLYYATARIKQKNEEQIYRSYVADTLRNISQNMAVVSAAYGGEGKFVDVRYLDIIKPSPTIEEHRTAEEIIDSIKGKLAQ